MAAYRFSAQIIGRSSGRSATAAAAYRASERIEDERTGQAHDYRAKGGIVHSEILLPEDAPAWMADRGRLWNAVEAAEKRKDAQLVREVLLNLPHELNAADRRELVRDFVREEFVPRGMVADLNIHAPDREGDQRNHHAHVMLTMRTLTGAGFGPKARAWNETGQLEQWREAWARHQNRALERAGSRERVDHRSLEAQGIDREPEPKLGPVATQMERDGRRSHAGDDRRAVQDRNAERVDLKRQARVIDLAIERERRKPQRTTEPVRQDQARGPDEEGPRRTEGLDRSAWANRQRAEQQSRHHREQIELGWQHDQQKAEQRWELAAIYGQPRRDLTRRADALEREIEGSRGLRKLVRAITGADVRARQELEEARRTLADIAQREGEQEGRLGLQQAQETRLMQDRQESERAALERFLASPAATQARDADRARERAEELRQAAMQREGGDRSRSRGRDYGHER